MDQGTSNNRNSNKRDCWITVSRALAAVIITNAHYKGVYPIPALAAGGLLGDVLFFAVSGYCLANIRQSFHKWYKRRILRIYPSIVLTCLLFISIGFYKPSGLLDVVNLSIYPTNCHFVASIMILYIVFFFVMTQPRTPSNIILIMSSVAIAFFVYYAGFYDKSTYRIDNVRMWPIRVLFFEAMLMGAYFKRERNRLLNQRDWRYLVIAPFILISYLASKLLFVKYEWLSPYQLANWVALLATLYTILRIMIGLEDRIQALPRVVLAGTAFVASITLEIYIVQYELIPRLANKATFPLNFILVTSTIVVLATLIHSGSICLRKFLDVLPTPKESRRKKTL